MEHGLGAGAARRQPQAAVHDLDAGLRRDLGPGVARAHGTPPVGPGLLPRDGHKAEVADGDRKSTRLNSSHLVISYAVFCLKKKITQGLPLPSLLALADVS